MVRQVDREPGAAVADAVLSLRHIARHSPSELRLRIAAADGDNEALIQSLKRLFLAAGAGAVDLEVGTDEELTSFEALASRRLAAALREAAEASDPSCLPSLVADEVARVSEAPRWPGVVEVSVPSSDDVALSAYHAGSEEAPAVVLVLPCGMPVELCGPWMSALAGDYRVLTWETRGLLCSPDRFDRVGVGVADQVADLLSVLRHFEVNSAHVVGLCGGAVIALEAAARQPECIRSVVAGYGDYILGASEFRTRHQLNFEWLISTAAAGRADARELQTMFMDRKTLATVPAEVAHLVLFPYLNAELFYRYARLNDALNRVDVRPTCGALDKPVLVVAGDADETVELRGSQEVARRIHGADLRVEQGGTHVSFFRADERSLHAVRSFLEGVASCTSDERRASS